MTRRNVVQIAAVLVSFLTARAAYAGWSCPGACTYTGTASAETIIFGCLDTDGDGDKEIGVCVNGTPDVLPGETDCTFNVVVDVKGGGGADTVRIVHNSVTLDCDGAGSAPNITFSAPLYSGSADVDLWGGDGDDIVHGGGAANSFDDDMNGDAEADFIWGYGSGININAGTGDDPEVISYNVSSNNDILNGSSGTDCLEDYSGAASTFDCGTHPVGFPDSYRDNITGEVNCDSNAVASCD